jgi:hypothetical protein
MRWAGRACEARARDSEDQDTGVGWIMVPSTRPDGRVWPWFAAGCVVMADDGDDVVRLHGAGQDETMLFEGRATPQLTRQGPRTRSGRVFVQKGAVGQELPSSTGVDRGLRW